MKRVICVMFVFTTLWLCCTCLQLTSGLADSSVVYSCAGSTVTLPWTLSTRPGDNVLDIQWFYEGRSHEIIATMANGVFFVSPSYSGRVTHTSNAGIKISDVTTPESGNYSVQVIGRQTGGDVITLRQWVYVHITDSLQTSDGSLRLRQQPQPELSEASGQFHVVLTCGTFDYPSHPPFEVVWTTPSGEHLNSSSYLDGKFYLHLPNPVQGGTYNCTVPPALGCLHSNSTGEATLTVEQTEARMTLLESHQSLLEMKNAALERKNKELMSAVQRLTELSERSPHVSFHAKMTASVHLPPNTVLRLTKVTHNEGHAYDGDTGIFTAPVAGSYFFAGSTEAVTPDLDVTLSLRVEGVEVDYLWVTSDSRTKAGGVQAVVGLMGGQIVWLQSGSLNSSYWHQPTSFSGFLIH